MLRQVLVGVPFCRLLMRGLAHLCCGLALFSVVLCAGCEPTAQRTPPTPLTAETPHTAPPTAPAEPPGVEERPAPAPTALLRAEPPEGTDPYTGMTETGEPPPVDYHGDPLLWTPNLAYTLHPTSPFLENFPRKSSPVLPGETARRLEELQHLLWTEEGVLYFKNHETPVTKEQRARIELAILAEDLPALAVAKYIFVTGYWDITYAQEFAAQALEASPDDFNTLYVWTILQPDETPEKIAGFRHLLEMQPDSARILRELGMNLIGVGMSRTNIVEAIPYLEKSAQLDPHAKQGSAFALLGSAYLQLGDGDKALEYLKRAQTIHRSAHRRDLIELIEAGEIP